MTLAELMLTLERCRKQYGGDVEVLIGYAANETVDYDVEGPVTNVGASEWGVYIESVDSL